MTPLQIILDQNADSLDFGDPEAVLSFITDGNPSIWQQAMAPEPDPTLTDIEDAIAVVVPIRAGRAWCVALSEPPTGPLSGVNANHTIAWYKNAIANFDTPE